MEKEEGREGPEEVIEPEQRRQGPNLTQENGATLIDHVIDHGLTLREAGLVQPNLSTNTVVTVKISSRKKVNCSLLSSISFPVTCAFLST